MSAVDFGRGNTTRYGTFTGPAVPNGDWCAAIWERAIDLSGNSIEYAVGVGSFGGTNSWHMLIPCQTSGFGGEFNFSSFGTTGTQVDDAFNAGSWLPSDGKSRLFIAQRNGSNLDLVVVPWRSTSLPTVQSYAYTTNGVVSSTWTFGARSDLNTARFTKNPLGKFFFKSGSILTPEQMLYLAQGNPISDIFSSVDCRIDLDSITSPYPDTSADPPTSFLTLNGTGFTTDYDFYGRGPELANPTHPVGRSPRMLFTVPRQFAVLAAGGNVYNAAAADSAAATDAAGTQAVVSAAASDSATATDAATTQIVVSAAATDNAAVTDSATAQLTQTASATDNGAATDSASSVAAFNVAATDNGAATDAATVQLTQAVYAADNAAATDAATTSVIFNVSATDNAAATDAATTQAAQNASAVDNAAASDTASTTAVQNVSATDNAAATDAATSGAVSSVDAEDSGAATDSADSSGVVVSPGASGISRLDLILLYTRQFKLDEEARQEAARRVVLERQEAKAAEEPLPRYEPRRAPNGPAAEVGPRFQVARLLQAPEATVQRIEVNITKLPALFTAPELEKVEKVRKKRREENAVMEFITNHLL